MNKILFLLCLPFKIIQKLLGLTESILKNFLQFLKLYILCCILYYLGAFKPIQSKIFEMQGKYSQMQYIAKQKACMFVDCEVRDCGESVCVY